MSELRELKVDNRRGNKNYKIVVEKYNSAQEMVRDCDTRTITDSCFTDQRKKSYDSWEGVKSYQEALDLLSNGYQPSVDKLKSRLKTSAMGNGKRITFRNDIVGYAPIVPLAIQGVPQSMINHSMKPIKAKVLDIYYDMTCSYGTSSNTIMECGRKVLSVILDLESQGYRANLYGVQSYSGYEGADIVCVKVKSANQPIDLKRVSFPLTHTAFFRVIGFDWYSKCPKAKYRSGYGHALYYDYRDNMKKLQEMVREIFDCKQAVYISASQIQHSGEDWLKGVIIDESGNGKR